MLNRYRTIHLYIALEFILSFSIAFAFLFFCFFVNQLLLIVQDTLSKNVPPSSVVQLIIFAIPQILSFTFPYSAMVGTFMAFGRLSSENEVVGMLSCGISKVQLLIPVLVLGLVITFMSYFTNDILLPIGNLKYRKLLSELIVSQPEVELSPFTVKNNEDQSLVTAEVKDGVFQNLLIFDQDDESNQRVILAEKSSIEQLDSMQGGISLQMNNVFILAPTTQELNSFTYQQAERIEYNIPLSKITTDLLNPGPRELPTKNVYDYLQVLKETQAQEQEDIYQKLETNYLLLSTAYESLIARNYYNQRTIADIAEEVYDTSIILPETKEQRNWYLEFLQKFTLPIITIPFLLLAFPLSITNKRSGKSMGFIIGILFCVIHWSMLAVSRILGFKFFNFPISIIMWSPVFIFLMGGMAYYIRSIIDFFKLRKIKKLSPL